MFQFKRLLAGAFGITITVAAVLFSLDRIPQLSTIKAKYPIAVAGVWIFDLMILYATFRPIMFFLLVVLVPFLLWIVHAATRSRGLKNKLNNKMDQLGAPVYGDTPMGYVLTLLGIETKDMDD